MPPPRPMPVPAPVKRRRLAPHERRAIILQAAEQVFAENGFAGASLDEVARLSGVTKPVIYDHFESKAALFYAAAESVRDELLRRGGAARVAGDPRASLRAAIGVFFEFVSERPTGARLLFVVPKSDPTAAEAAAIVQRKARDAIAAGLAPLMAGRQPWEIEAAAVYFQKGLHALAEWWLDTGGPSGGALADVVFDMAWQGLQPSRR